MRGERAIQCWTEGSIRVDPNLFHNPNWTVLWWHGWKYTNRWRQNWSVVKGSPLSCCKNLSYFTAWDTSSWAMLLTIFHTFSLSPLALAQSACILFFPGISFRTFCASVHRATCFHIDLRLKSPWQAKQCWYSWWLVLSSLVYLHGTKTPFPSLSAWMLCARFPFLWRRFSWSLLAFDLFANRSAVATSISSPCLRCKWRAILDCGCSQNRQNCFFCGTFWIHLLLRHSLQAMIHC